MLPGEVDVVNCRDRLCNASMSDYISQLPTIRSAGVICDDPISLGNLKRTFSKMSNSKAGEHDSVLIKHL